MYSMLTIRAILYRVLTVLNQIKTMSWICKDSIAKLFGWMKGIYSSSLERKFLRGCDMVLSIDPTKR